MRVTVAEELIFEITEDELFRLFNVPAGYRAIDAKVEKDTDDKRRIGVRFRKRGRTKTSPLPTENKP